MSVWVYVLQSTTSGRLYVGITGNLRRRLAEHNGGHCRSTRTERPWRVVHKEPFQDHASARLREKFLKSGQRREWLKVLLADRLPPL